MEDVKFDAIVPRTKNIAKLRQEEFERKKNTKALLYATVIAACVFLIFFLISWKTPEPELPLKEDLVQVSLEDVDVIDLGNNVNGSGTIQPLVKGDFASEEVVSKMQQAKSSSDNQEEPSDPVTNDKNQDAPEIYKPPTKSNNPPKTYNDNPPKNNDRPVTNPNPNPAPPTPKPKVNGGPWKRPGGTGTGNGADRDNGFSNQGNGTGNGDAGDPFGKPGGTGTKITNASLKNRSEIERLTSQSGTNYKGKITVQLKVDESGNVSSIGGITVSPANSESKAAKTYLRENVIPKLKFGAGADGRTGSYTFDFDY